MQSNVDAIIAQVKSDLEKYDDMNLLSESSMYREIVLGLRNFGNDVAQFQEAVVHVENYEVALPEGFFSLHLAALCDPFQMRTKEATDHLQESNIFRERTEYNRKFSECESCPEEFETKLIKEDVFVKGKVAVEYFYSSPRLLTLGKSFKRTECTKSCLNKYRPECPEEINILNGKLQTNFKEGTVYIQYYGLPLDEEGNIEIPDTPNGHLEQYLEYRLKYKLGEKLLANGNAQHLGQLLNTYMQRETMFARKASNELKMKSLTPNRMRQIAWKNRMEMLKYETPYRR